MHSVNNISERNKIDTHQELKLETEKTPKTLSSGQIYKKKKNPQKKQKTHCSGLKKNGFFPTLVRSAAV
jgi:hypothetical protein